MLELAKAQPIEQVFGVGFVLLWMLKVIIEAVTKG